MPAYSIPEAAHYLQMPPSTLRSWVKGWTYRTDAGEQFSSPLLVLPEPPAREPLLLSFVNIDPYVSFGCPVLVGTGIPTAVIADRYKAGESIQALAHDYERSPHDIEEAIRYELNTQAA